MIASFSLLLTTAVLALAKPIEVRTVAALNTAAFEEAQQRDNTATRAFANTEILTSDGQCLFINELSGDFRANLNPIQVAPCDGSQGQLWDVITAGEHDDQAGTMLVVNTLTQACMNFDPRRAAGNTVIMFSCGGRADGGGAVTNSQLFNFTGGAGPLALAPINAVGTCLTVTSNNVLDSAACSGDSTQSFTFGGGSAASVSASTTAASAAVSSTAVSSPVSELAASTSSSSSSCTSTTILTMTRSSASASAAASTTILSSSALTTSAPISSAAAAATEISSNPTSAVPVSGAGGVLNPSAAAESNPRDNTATRAFTSVSIKTSSGSCLSINPLAGDFRQNLIPVAIVACSSSDAGQQFDLITAGAHNNAVNATLVVSSLTQGCLNFDPRRAAGNQVLLFSCGGRADGGGATTNSQLFTYDVAAKPSSLTLQPESGEPVGSVCLEPNAGTGLLDDGACDGGAGQVFTVG
ncbi:uncharacterized protein LY89DRAFT_685954 [Mollisia scopiformis]|uniref:Ricin B lectin domain-containing protein n=1 Tax=Mollisia scopiformis TaxID=149040 RepID=A0A194X4Z0_MOLSC|nr:uncharacterized protein LY89DRAFT_685954 [Mollisia scopiformis]KUJ15139.1 hypothetical protein LY89DRAFT_685954 [Mollisia scopiformis]